MTWSFVCCLSSLNVLHYDDWKDTDAVETMIFFLDAVISEFVEKLDGMFSIIKTGLKATQHDMGVISNNLANASTNGFKKSKAQFEDMYFSQHNNSTNPARGMGVTNVKPRQSFAQGSFQQTNGSLDLAIMGEGFFVLGEPIGRDDGVNPKFKFTSL